MKKYKHHNASLSKFQFQVAIGSMLGDMSASKPANGANYHLSCYHSEKQADWLNQKWTWLQPYTRPIQVCAYTDKRDGKTRRGSRFHTVSAPCFSDIAEHFYTNGRKIIPYQIADLMVHPVALACLICDDGSWDKAGVSIATKQFTLEDNERLAVCIRQNFGLAVTVYNHGKYPHIRIPAQSVESAMEICREFVPDTMIYKFGGGGYETTLVGRVDHTCPTCGVSFLAYASSNAIYCSQKCAAAGRETGYITRQKTAVCPICRMEYTVYNGRQKTCIPCREKPFPDEICVVCGSPVKKRGNKTCSRRCNVIAGHRSRKKA